MYNLFWSVPISCSQIKTDVFDAIYTVGWSLPAVSLLESGAILAQGLVVGKALSRPCVQPNPRQIYLAPDRGLVHHETGKLPGRSTTAARGDHSKGEGFTTGDAGECLYIVNPVA